MIRVFTVVLIAALAGCGSLGSDKPSGPTLSDLEAVELERESSAVPRLEYEALVSIYRGVLAHQDDPEVRTQILHRLADIEMLAGEDRLASAIDDRRLFDPAISAYENLLQENPQYERRDTILYQLSKAYELRGDAERSTATLAALKDSAPDSPYLAEASFRLAERHFVQGQYSRAEATYEQVTDFGSATPFYTRSQYMLGWARFKQNRYYDSIEPFTHSLDAVLSGGEVIESLPRSQKELVEDSLRVLALAFSNLDGTNTIVQAYESMGERPYQHVFYEALGALYLNQERFRDSAQVYQDYLTRYPETPLAHRFQLEIISAFEAGGFPALILAAKQDYVEKFAVASDYWRSSDAAARESLQPTLQRYLEELSSHFHALGQAEDAAANAASTGAATSLENYQLAAHYYRAFVASFPQDPAVPEKTFLLAQCLSEAGDYTAAIAAYDDMAYAHSDHPKAAEAAYRGILAYAEIAGDGNAADHAVEGEIEAKLRFAKHFSNDERAAAVLGDAARQLFLAQQYESAVAAATELLARDAQSPLTLSALLVLGHSQFALEHFEDAEFAFGRALPLIPLSDARYKDTQRATAAALYRQAEAQQRREQNAVAAGLFERAVQAAPDSEIATTALYDAASAYLAAEDLTSANARFMEFRKRYPTHALAGTVAPLLIRNFEKMEQWEAAAVELDVISNSALDEQERRSAQLSAAQYYDKAGAIAPAIDRYRSYAHEWPQPLAPRLEVMHRLKQLYSEQTAASGQQDKVAFWLRKIELAHAEAGAQQTDRTAFLAAQACTTLAEGLLADFKAIPLNQPIKSSLKRKRHSMQGVLQAYTRCSGYAVEQFTTLSSLRIAQTYQSFSSALMNSERPALDALALEQYDLMLEEQAFPFEDKAIAVLESNIQRCWKSGVYDEAVKESFAALAALVPARYSKQEKTALDTAVFNRHGAEITRNRGKQRRLQALNEAAIAQRVEGDFESAKKRYEKALALAEDDAVTHRNLGILLDLYLGDAERALTHYQRYQALTGGTDRSVAGWIALLERRTVSVASGA